jgi:hypothetical protein
MCVKIPLEISIYKSLQQLVTSSEIMPQILAFPTYVCMFIACSSHHLLCLLLDLFTVATIVLCMQVTPKDVEYYSSQKIPKPQEVDEAFRHILFRPRLAPKLEFVKVQKHY